MLNIPKKIAYIEELVAQGTVQSLTYAALECRLMIEHICYERLVNSHKYFSHEDLRTWKPQQIVQQIAAEANELITEGLTVYISKEPIQPGCEPKTAEDHAALKYVEVGEQIALNISKLHRLHNALSGVGLHIDIPKDYTPIEFYGDQDTIRKKVEEALGHFRELAKGSLIAGAFGQEYSFSCEVCGSHIRRKADLLKDQQVISCFNAKCLESYTIHRSGGDLEHSRRTMDVTCTRCAGMTSLPAKKVEKLRLGEQLSVPCPCGHPAVVALFPHSVSPKVDTAAG